MIAALLRRARRAACVLPWRVRNRDAILRRLGFSDASLVTLDVFDTALVRSVAQPVDAFWLAAWRLQRRRSGDDMPLDIEAIAHARIAAEHAARARARAAGRSEVTLDEIYAEMPARIAPLQALMDEECATERDVCFSNPDILSLYAHLQAHGRRVAFISDTYLPSDVIKDLLRGAGYGGALLVFASSAFGKSKADGSLFAEVQAACGVDARNIWHIGDNAAADVQQARAAGWNALWYNARLRPVAAPSAALAGERRVVAALLDGAARSLVPRTRPARATPAAVWQSIGHTVAAPIFLGLAQCVVQEIHSHDIDRVAFCARDGRIIQAVFERLRGCAGPLPPSFYLMVSRRALVFPMLDQVGEAELDFLTGQFAALRVDEVLARIGLDPTDHAAAIAHAGLAAHQRVASALEMGALRGLLRALTNDVLDQAARERALLVDYLNQEAALAPGQMALVDVGWQGSLQKALGRLIAQLGRNVRMRGIYFGTNPNIRALPPEAGSAHGWFADAGEPAARFQLTRAQWAVLELLFTAPHGSVLGYRREPNGITAVLDDKGGAGDCECAAASIQRAALAAIDRYISAFGGLAPATVLPEDVMPRLERLALAPTLMEATAIGNLFQVDGIGATRTGQYIARPPHFGDVRALRHAAWRRGYLVRAFGGTRAALAAIAAIRLVRPGFKSA